MGPAIDFQAINRAVLPHLPRLIRLWLRDGRQEGVEWVARNPLRADRHLGSFKINLCTGRWADFATGDRGGTLCRLSPTCGASAKAMRRPSSPKGWGSTMLRALFAPRLPAGALSSHPQLGKPAAWWVYQNGAGQPVAVVYRFDTGEGKEYRPYDLVAGRWGAPTWRPLYRLPSIAASRDRVILVEGEKCADALARFGLVATTGFGGANGIGKTDLSPLKGRDVIIWPDADVAGARYAKDGREALRNVGAASVRVAPIDTNTLRNVAERTGAPHVTLHAGWDAADAVGPDGGVRPYIGFWTRPSPI